MLCVASSRSVNDDLLPWLLEEFPYLHLSPATLHILWHKGSLQQDLLSRAETSAQLRRTKAQEQVGLLACWNSEHFVWRKQCNTSENLLLLLQPSLLRGLATPCTSCLHLAWSSVYTRILSNVYPVHWKMLSIHIVFRLPLFRDPGVVPCIICFSKLSELLRITCPKYVNFLAFTDSRRLLDTSALSSTQSFVRFAVHDTRSIWRSPHISKACILFSSAVLSVQLSQP